MYLLQLSCRIFLISIVVYAVITLPALFLGFVFFISLVIAFIYGLIALGVFLLCFSLLKNLRIKTGYYLLYGVIPLAVVPAFHAIGPTLLYENVWQSSFFLLFPLAAVAGGWIALYRCREEVTEQFNNMQNA